MLALILGFVLWLARIIDRMGNRFEIWDAHGHISGVPGDTPEARLGKLLEYADRMGIARLCMFMGLKWNYDPSPETMRQERSDVLGILLHAKLPKEFQTPEEMIEHWRDVAGLIELKKTANYLSRFFQGNNP